MYINPIKVVNGFMIYRRQRKHETWVLPYVAYPDRDEYEPSIGEFKTLRQAEAVLKKLTPPAQNKEAPNP